LQSLALLLSCPAQACPVNLTEGNRRYRKRQQIKAGEREGAEWVVREGVGAGARNDPSIVCTYE
jgi:hypothetical protein